MASQNISKIRENKKSTKKNENIFDCRNDKGLRCDMKKNVRIGGTCRRSQKTGD